jgi:hypothetical protein
MEGKSYIQSRRISQQHFTVDVRQGVVIVQFGGPFFQGPKGFVAPDFSLGYSM